MKVQYMSDLHLEMLANREYVGLNPIIPNGEVLVLAGDITLMKDSKYQDEIFDYFSKNWKLVLMVPGNHEYYKTYGEIDKLNINRKIRENVLLVNNEVVKYKDVNFICTTLWSHIPVVDSYTVEQSLNDFRLIRGTSGRYNTMSYNYNHRKCLGWLEDSLAELKGQKNIVVTHHAPTQLVNAFEYVGSPINSAFVVELHDLIHDNDINYWIYGHTHRNIDAEINGTRIVSNQLGYVGYEDINKFNHKKTIKI